MRGWGSPLELPQLWAESQAGSAGFRDLLGSLLVASASGDQQWPQDHQAFSAARGRVMLSAANDQQRPPPCSHCLRPTARPRFIPLMAFSSVHTLPGPGHRFPQDP